MMTKRDYQRRAFNKLRLHRNSALSCAEKYGIETALISMYSIDGYIESLFDMDIISDNTYDVLNTWLRNLSRYIHNNYDYKK